MMRIATFSLVFIGSVGAQQSACSLDEVTTIKESSDELMPLVEDCFGIEEAVAFQACFASAADQMDNDCARCVVAALDTQDVECVMSCAKGGDCSCAFPAAQHVLNGCFPVEVASMLLPMVNSAMGELEESAPAPMCALSSSQLSTLPVDLTDCYSHSSTAQPAACMENRGYTNLSADCHSCLFVTDADICNCSDPSSDECVSCVSSRVTMAMMSCTPQWDPRFDVPSEEMCSMDDLMTIPSEADFRDLVRCVTAGTDTGNCWPESMSSTCSGCLGTIIVTAPSSCTGSCLEDVASAVMGRCLGVGAPPQVAACTEADRELFTSAQVDESVLSCNVSDPNDIATCLADSPVHALSSGCIACVAVAPVWVSDPACASACSVDDTTGDVTCTSPSACTVDAVDTSFCFDPNGMSVGDEFGSIPSVCTIAELTTIGSSFTEADVNECLSKTVAVDAYTCVTDIVGDSTECVRCVAATISVVAGCNSICTSDPSAQTCQDCVSGAVTNAAGSCTSKGMPKFASDLIAKAAASGAPTWSLALATAVVLSVM